VPADVAAWQEKLAARDAEIEYLQAQLAAADGRQGASGESKSTEADQQQALLRGLAADAAHAVVEKLRGELEGTHEALAALQGQYDEAQRHIATLTFQLEQVRMNRTSRRTHHVASHVTCYPPPPLARGADR